MVGLANAWILPFLAMFCHRSRPHRYAYERSFESKGAYWITAFNQYIWCIWMFVFFTAAVLLAKHGFTASGVLLGTLTPVIFYFRRSVFLSVYLSVCLRERMLAKHGFTASGVLLGTLTPVIFYFQRSVCLSA
jgi:hypothetical protein